MQTNDFINELEKINPNFSELDTINNLWNGFSIDRDGVSLYEKHLNSLFINYFIEIEDHTDKLLLNKSSNEIKLFTNSKINRFEAIKTPFVKWDNEFYSHHIVRLNNDINDSESFKWSENNRYFQLYEKKSILMMKQERTRLQLEYDFLTCKIDKVTFKIGLNEWITHEDAEDEGWDEEFIEQHFCKLRMERICREYIDKSLKHLNDIYNFYLSSSTSQQTTEQKQSTKTIHKERTIDAEKLQSYFLPAFKGMGNGTINHFDSMIEELKTNRSAKEFARIALIIYESDKVNRRKPKTFAEWHKIFCECIGCEQIKYDPNKLRNPRDNLKKLFAYLN